MKKQILFLLVLLGLGSATFAQQHEYRLAKSSGTLKVSLNNVIIEGYDGKDIVLTGQKIAEEEVDDRAKGLVPINSSGFTDNTGLGLSVSNNGQEVQVKPSSKKSIGQIKIQVPHGLKISMLDGSNFLFTTGISTTGSGDIILKNIKNEIEISLYKCKIKLENNTGPMNVKTVSGPIEAVFNSEIKGPISLTSATDYVDVTLPTSAKANIELGTSVGKIYAAKEFNIDFEKQPSNFASNIISLNVVKDARTGLTRTITTRKDAQTGDTTMMINGEVVANGVSVSGVNINGTGRAAITGKPNKANDVTIIAKGQAASSGSSVAIVGGNDQDSVKTVRYGSLAPTSIYFGGERVKGKLNGGGPDLILRSNSKNVYLRYK